MYMHGKLWCPYMYGRHVRLHIYRYIVGLGSSACLKASLTTVLDSSVANGILTEA
jgi:hypothetical protein